MAMKQLIEKKAVPIPIKAVPAESVMPHNAPFKIASLGDITKESDIYKAVIPRFLYKPVFGYPRFVDIPEVRRLAETPYVEMCISTIIDEISAVKWDIVPKDDKKYNQTHIDLIKQFFENPNVNEESFDALLRKVIRDILTIDSGVFVKVFDAMQRFKQLMVYDGGTFLKNPDPFGTFDGKADILPSTYSFAMTNPNLYDPKNGDVLNRYRDDLQNIARTAAYFQYGWTQGARPMPFGLREVVYMMKCPRSNDIYGKSPMEILMKTVQTLTYGIDYSHDYFTNNYIPKGVMQLLGAQQEEIEQFQIAWQETMRTKNDVGTYVKQWHKMPMINYEGKFIPIQFSAQELELISQQQWFTKLVWACFGVTPSEMGFTDDSNRATEIVQSRVFRRKAIRPILTLIEYHLNSEVITEFDTGAVLEDGTEISGITDVQFKFIVEDPMEEKEKMELYEMKLKNGIVTPNEVREELGMDPIEGGDELRGSGMFDGGFGGGFGNDQSKQNPFEDKEPKEKKARESKPTEKGIEKIILNLLDENMGKVMAIMDTYSGEDKLTQIKAIENIIPRIQEAISPESIRQVILNAIREVFSKAIEDNELKFNMNFIPRVAVIDFLQKSAFGSIKGMTDDIANKLGQRLRVAVREGWSVTKIRNDIADLFDGMKPRAEMIARTEVINAENKATYEIANQSGLKGEMVWIAALDNATCPRCRDLDGKAVDINTKFHTDAAQGWDGYHPCVHPNCRCSVEFRPEE